MMIKNFKNIVIAVFVFVNSAAFAQYNPETDTYTLQDSDVVVENGVIMSCSTDADDWGTGKLVIPDRLGGGTVIAIKDGDYSQNVFGAKKITHLYLPVSIIRVGDYSFSGCPIQSISFPENCKLKYLGESAFMNNRLSCLFVPSSVILISPFAFYNNELEQVKFEINSFLRVIQEDAFGGNSDLNGIRLPANANPGFNGYKKLQFGVAMGDVDGDFSEFNNLVVADLPFYVLTPLDVKFVENEIVDFYAGYNNIVIPEYMNGELIKRLGEGRVVGNYIDSLILPNSIDSLKAFSIYENNIQSFTLPHNVKIVESRGVDMQLNSVYYAKSSSVVTVEKMGLGNGALPAQVIKEGFVFTHWENSGGETVDAITSQVRGYEAQFAQVTAFDISGSITIDNITGTSIILDGDFEGTRYPDSDGNFEFLLNEGRTMTLTPKKEGYVFTPENREISNLSSDLDELHFTAEKSENIISGKIDIDDASDIYLQISGDYYAAVKVNDDGTYAFPVNEGRNIKIMPLKDGYTFMPESIDIENASGAISENNFKTVESSYTLSGTVDIDEVGDLVIKAGGDMNKTMSVGSDGRFSFQGYSNVSVIITPEKAGYTFSPESITINPVEDEVNGISFTSHRKSFSVSGTVNLASIEGVELEIGGDTSFVQPLDANGNFEFSLLARKNITITPTKEGIIFSPETIVVDDLQKNEENKNFELHTVTATDVACSITVSPNPTKGTVIIQSAEMIEAVTLISQEGKTLLTSKVHSNKQYLDISSYADGTYYLKVETSSGTYKGIIVKQ